MKKKLRPVEGSADEDMKEIEEADQIRLHHINDPGSVKHVNSSSMACFALFF